MDVIGIFVSALGVLFDGLGDGVDGHAAVEFLNLNSASNWTGYVVGCIFHNSKKSALVVNQTNDLQIRNNVFYNNQAAGTFDTRILVILKT